MGAGADRVYPQCRIGKRRLRRCARRWARRPRDPRAERGVVGIGLSRSLKLPGPSRLPGRSVVNHRQRSPATDLAARLHGASLFHSLSSPTSAVHPPQSPPPVRPVPPAPACTRWESAPVGTVKMIRWPLAAPARMTRSAWTPTPRTCAVRPLDNTCSRLHTRPSGVVGSPPIVWHVFLQARPAFIGPSGCDAPLDTIEGTSSDPPHHG